MKKQLTLVSAVLVLTGCFSDLSEINAFMESVKTSTVPRVEPVPEVKEFEHIAYVSHSARSPFVIPKPEALQERYMQLQDCLHPDPSRVKEPLERYSVDNLKMRGTLGNADNLSALVESADRTVHRITLNNYLGLFNGKVMKVEPTHIELLELIPDGAGCWKERHTRLQMVETPAIVSN